MPLPKTKLTDKPWQPASLPPSDGGDSQWASSDRNADPSDGSAALTDARAGLEQRARGLGIRYAEHLPLTALMAAVHQGEADGAANDETEAMADRAEREVDTIGEPVLRNPALDAPPPRPLALDRDSLEDRATGSA